MSYIWIDVLKKQKLSCVDEIECIKEIKLSISLYGCACYSIQQCSNYNHVKKDMIFGVEVLG